MAYTMIIGGFTLLEDGQVVTNAANSAIYSNLTAEHVQYIWSQIVNSKHAEDIQIALSMLNKAIGEAMCELGNIKIFEDGDIDDQVLDTMNRFFDNPVINEDTRKKLVHGGRKKNEQ